MPVNVNRTSVRRRLLAWFRKHARPLPWRSTRDPYAIWISEVMLQQTQVATVIPYFERFLARFPNVQALAQADDQEVLRLWEGLGYYRRAHSLLAAARRIHEHKHATIPDDLDFARTLPGFGRYTANAVLSQAYDRALPILEANSARVLCRLFGIDANPKEPAVQKQLWQLAETLVPSRCAGDFNQALMELGALVCTPTTPGCRECPLIRECVAHQQDRQHEIPRRPTPPKVVAVAEVAVIVRRQGKLLLVQRPDEGRWARMWEFPHHPLQEGESNEAAAQRLLKGVGIEGKLANEIAVIRHSVTRFRITMTCFAVDHGRGAGSGVWVRPTELHAYPLSAPQRRLARLLAGRASDGVPD